MLVSVNAPFGVVRCTVCARQVKVAMDTQEIYIVLVALDWRSLCLDADYLCST